MKLSVVIFAVIVISLTACQETSITGQFHGKWNWLKTDGSGLAGPYESTPETAGYTQQIEFASSKEVTITIGNNLERYTYSIQKEKHKMVLVLEQQGNQRKEFIELSEDTLILSNYEPCCDNDYKAYFKKSTVTE